MGGGSIPPLSRVPREGGVGRRFTTSGPSGESTQGSMKNVSRILVELKRYALVGDEA